VSRQRVLIVDDHENIRQTLRRLVYGGEVVGEAGNGQEAVEAAERLQPDLVLLDIAMPVMNGFAAAQLLRERVPEARIIFVSSYLDPAYVEEAFRLGAHGYVLKRAATTELTTAIEEVLAGRTFRSPLVSAGRSSD
jgi:DNA-binding NarL/FixJ family response regulator